MIGVLVIAFSRGKLQAMLFAALYAGPSSACLYPRPKSLMWCLLKVTGQYQNSRYHYQYRAPLIPHHPPPLPPGSVWALLTPSIVPSAVLWYGQAANIPMILLGKFIQIVTNFRNGHTGQVQGWSGDGGLVMVDDNFVMVDD